MCACMNHRVNGLGCGEASVDELGGLLSFYCFSVFHNILFCSVYSMGVVLTVCIWWEFNIVNSKYGGTWAMLLNMVGDLACNGL